MSLSATTEKRRDQTPRVRATPKGAHICDSTAAVRLERKGARSTALVAKAVGATLLLGTLGFRVSRAWLGGKQLTNRTPGTC